MFNLKYPAMLCFDTEASADPRSVYNLKSLFGLSKVPSDTQMREIVDPVAPETLRPCFEALHQEILAAVTVHPDRKTVLPLAVEPITKRDGDNKNDFKRNAAK